MAIEQCIYTIEQLRERLAHWQRVLRLQDWHIEVMLVPMASMGGDFAGEVTTFPMKKRAFIKVLTAADYEASMERGRQTMPHDMEYTLIHELMHVVIYLCSVKYDPGSREEMLEEQAVHALAMGYLQLSRPSLASLPQAYTPLPLDLQPPSKPHLAVSNPQPVMDFGPPAHEPQS